jgi:hypothetical protein
MTYQQEKFGRIKRKVTNIVCHNYSLNPTNTKMNEQATWNTPKFLYRFKCEFEVKTAKEQGVKARSLARSILGVEGHAGALGWD